MKKFSIIDLRSRLKDLQREELVAQSKETLLSEDKKVLLSEIQEFFVEIEKLNLFSKEELIPTNLQFVVDKLRTYIDNEISQSKIFED